MAISFHARGKLQTQAVNPQYRCPPNGRPGMNGTCSQPDLNTKQRKKNSSDLPHTSAIHKYLQQLQGQQPPSSPIAHSADAHLNKRDNAGKSHMEGNRRRGAGVPQFYNGNSDAAQCGQWEQTAPWRVTSANAEQNTECDMQVGCPRAFPGRPAGRRDGSLGCTGSVHGPHAAGVTKDDGLNLYPQTQPLSMSEQAMYCIDHTHGNAPQITTNRDSRRPQTPAARAATRPARRGRRFPSAEASRASLSRPRLP